MKKVMNNSKIKAKEFTPVDYTKLGDKKIIDLVIPCYKAKETLMRLFASVVMQSMRKNIHVILVQDADGEDYSQLLTIFSQMLDIEMLVLGKNSGPGTCRRIGMKHGKCKYIICMDADDTFQNPFAAQELYEAIESNKLDAVSSMFLEQVGQSKFITHENDWVWMFGKIYRRKFLEDNKIEMNDSRANEDTGFNTVVYECGKTGYLPDITYIWHYKEDSITRVDDGIYRFTGVKGWIYNMKWAIDNMIRLNIEEDKIKQRVARILMNLFIWYNEYVVDEDKRVNVNEYVEWVEEFMLGVYNEHIPSYEMLENMYKEYGHNSRLTDYIPQISLKDFIKLVGGEIE